MITDEELRRFEVSRGRGYQPVETGATRVPPSSTVAASEDCVKGRKSCAHFKQENGQCPYPEHTGLDPYPPCEDYCVVRPKEDRFLRSNRV